MAKRRPVNYNIEEIENSEESNQIEMKNTKTIVEIPPKDPPSLPKRGLNVNNNSTTSSLNSSYTSSSQKNTLEIPKRNYLFTQKRLFAGDKQRTANNLNILEPTSIEEYVMTPGLNPRSAIKDLRKHVRASTRGYEDNGSIDSGKSTRDEASNKIKKAFEELEILRKRNAELEKLSNIQKKKPGEGSEMECEKEWKEIKDCTIQIMEHLGLVPKKSVSKDAGPLSKKPVEQSAKIPSPPEMSKEETVLTLSSDNNETVQKDPDPVITAESDFGKDLISMMQGFKF